MNTLRHVARTETPWNAGITRQPCRNPSLERGVANILIPKRRGVNLSGSHRGMTSHVLPTTMMSSSELRPALVRADSDKSKERLVDKRPKRQVSFDDTADCHHDGLVLQMRGEPSLYVAARDYLKRNSWIPMALCLLCVVVLAAMPSIINMI